MLKSALILVFGYNPTVWAAATATVCISQSPDYVRAIVFPNGILAIQALPILNAVSGGEYRSKAGDVITIKEDKSFVLEVKHQYKITGNGTELGNYSKFITEQFGEDFQCYGGDAEAE